MNESDWIDRIIHGTGGLLFVVIAFAVFLWALMWTFFPVLTYFQLKRIERNTLEMATAVRMLSERLANQERDRDRVGRRE